MLKKQPFRIILIFIALTLSVVLLLLFILPGQKKSIIIEVSPREGELASAFGQIGVTFAQPMDHTSVEAAFSIHPFIEGRFFWANERVLVPASGRIRSRAIL